MKKQLKRLSRSLASQNAFLIILSGCIMFLFVLALNPLFYTVTKDELTENVSGSIREVTVRLGFLLSKHRPALQLAQEEDFIHLVRTYYEEPEHAETNRRRIIGHLNNYEEVGLDEASGTINNHNFFLFYTEAGDLFCQDETSALADALISTEWFQDTVLEEFNKRYSAPLPLTVEGETENYLCLIRQFTVDDMRCFSIHLTYMDDFIGQLKFLENVGIYDYILYCEDQILYQNTDDTCLDMGYLRENDYLSTTQYGVVSVPHTDGIDFAALCSISSENMYLLVHTSRAELMQPYNAFFRLLYISLGLLITRYACKSDYS